jgi:putative DNA primase/helicase
LNWALDGLHRLTMENGNRFTRIESADEAIVTMRDLASPVGAFVREKCKLDANEQIEVGALYTAYKNWCGANEHPKSSKHVFGRDLRAAASSVRVGQPREGRSTPQSLSRPRYGTNARAQQWPEGDPPIRKA